MDDDNNAKKACTIEGGREWYTREYHLLLTGYGDGSMDCELGDLSSEIQRSLWWNCSYWKNWVSDLVVAQSFLSLTKRLRECPLRRLRRCWRAEACISSSGRRGKLTLQRKLDEGGKCIHHDYGDCLGCTRLYVI
ncbi:hypothetical protein V2J09_016138 [Rumex salicifolius]